MPTDTDAKPARPTREHPPAGAESPERDGGPGDGSHADELISRSADGESLSPVETDYLTEYFLGGTTVAPGEGETDRIEIESNIGTDKHPRWQKFVMHSLDWDQWQICQERGKVRRKGEDQNDPLLRASYTVAFSTIEPDLGALRLRIPEEQEDPKTHQIIARPADTAELLRRFFKRIPGGLIDLETEVLKASKLNIMESSVREVETAGN
jgi:hypothetical protein